MENIIRGTTPTIRYTFESIDVADITAAFLTVKSGDTVIIEKDLTMADIEADAISWRFTQSETLTFGGEISVMINWLLSDGTRGASPKSRIVVERNYKEVVI